MHGKYPGVLAAFFVAVALGLAGCGAATLEFQLVDSVSGSWVWGATVMIQDRAIREFYQSDRGPVLLRFTGLAPGAAILRVAAPGYESLSVPVHLKPGANRLVNPIHLRAVEIPGLAGWVAFEHLEGGDVVVELRPVRGADSAPVNHPCLPLWVGARVCVQTTNGSSAKVQTDHGSARGEELFSGKLSYSWDSAPLATVRYSTRIPGSEIRQHSGPYRVIDYLIVVPDPTSITAAELEAVMAGLWSADREINLGRISRALDAEKGRLKWFVVTSWNVRARSS
jgi:hypothetical protein